MSRAKAPPHPADADGWLTPDCQMLQAGGLTFRVTRWHVGAPATPLLFLNGIGADANLAAPLLRRITGREVWTLDMPGTGASPDCFWPYSAQSLSRAVMGVADQLGHDRLDIAGFSWGGALAQQVAGQFPERIGHMALLATASQIGLADIGWGAAFDRDVVRGSMRMPVVSPLGLTYQHLSMAGWSNMLLARSPTDRQILVMTGSDDQVIPAHTSLALIKQLGAQRHVTISGSHLFPFAKAEDTASALTAFFSAADAECESQPAPATA